MTKRVYWTVLMERSIQEHAVNALLAVASHNGRLGYSQIMWPYQRVDVARNAIVKAFRERAESPDDTLVMLDADHTHPADTVERLVAHDVDVVGALAFTRGAPFTPCWFIYDNGFHPGYEWGDNKGLMACDAVGTGAIAIKRRTFDILDEQGFGPYFFQAVYLEPAPKDLTSPSEDMYFATTCYQAGIKHHVDLGLCTPHLTVGAITEQSFRDYVRDNPPPAVMEVTVHGNHSNNVHD